MNLTVHGVGKISREFDPSEDRTWVSVEQLELVLDAVVGRPDVRITFDDGNTSDVEVGLPRLLERGLRAEFFILAGEFDRDGRLDRDGVRELLGAGMAVGSHGWAHRDWRRLTEAEARQEMVDAPKALRKLTGRAVTRVAIPFGSYDRHVITRLRRVGVTRVYTSDRGRALPGSWMQARTSLPHDLDEAWVAKVLGPAQPIQVARGVVARTLKRWRGRP